MQCPFCKADDDHVVDSRVIGAGKSIRRRRECLSCHKRFTTYERVEAAPRLVTKKDFRRELFDRKKILGGLAKACKKRNITAAQLDAIVDRIEGEVFEEFDSPVETRVIGEKVSENLRKLDQVAYVRFASVYREYDDVGQFLIEVQDLDMALPPGAEKKN